MTREELMDDVKVGDNVIFYTESGVTFEGQIVDFGVSGLKIKIEENNTTKRIMYSKITEYDIKNETETSVEETKPSEKEDAKNTQDVSIVEQNDNKPNKQISKDIEKIRQEWIKKVNPAYKKECDQIINFIQYTKRIHEYTLNNERVRRAIALGESAATAEKAFYAIIATIYDELNDHATAEKLYRRANEISNSEPAKSNVSQMNDNKEEHLRKGTITTYSLENHFGFIEDENGENVFFYIAQVKDIVLQKKLLKEPNAIYHVKYYKGINYKGDVAADAIEIIGHKGIIDDYNSKIGVGKIKEGNKTYKFIDKSVINPLLLAAINFGEINFADLEVVFNTEDYYDKKQGRTYKVACNIDCNRAFTKEDVEKYYKQGLISKMVADDWSNNNNLEIIPYIPLKKYNDASTEKLVVFTNEEPKNSKSLAPEKDHKYTISVKDNKQLRLPDSKSENVKKAISLIIPEESKNEFLFLGEKNKGQKFYQKAHEYMVGIKDSSGNIWGIDLSKAEDFFIKAIQANDQAELAVANLAGYVYIKLGGNYIIKGLQLLEAYGYLLPYEKLQNLRIQLIDKSGNYEALELILLDAIPKCSKVNTKWQYMTKLAGIYYRRKTWDKAALWFDRSLVFLNNNKKSFTQFENLRNYCLRFCVITNYYNGRVDLAKSEGKELLNYKPGDIIIKSIVDGDLIQDEPDLFDFLMDDLESLIEEMQLEDDIVNAGDNCIISSYLNYILEKVNLSITFNKIKEISSKIQNGVYVGSSNDVKGAIRSITNSMRRSRTYNAQILSEIYIGISRIIFDSRNNASIIRGNKIKVDDLKKYIGRYARYAADALVVKYSTVDSIRFLYIQSLKNLADADTGNIRAATNMLIASFFVKNDKLPAELTTIAKEEMGGKYNDDYYSESCISAKDFMIATFMLQEKKEYVNRIFTKIYKKNILKNKLVEILNKIANQNLNVSSTFDFENLWNAAKTVYYSNINIIIKEIADSINEFRMVESTRQHIQRIEDLLKAKTLWNQDEKILEQYLNIMRKVEVTLEKYTVEEKIEGFRTIESDIERLRTEILESPTELSFDGIYLKLGEFKASIRNDFDELYRSSIPEWEITLSNDSVYIKDNTVKISIAFKNADNKQDADAVRIELEGSPGAIYTQCEKHFTSVKSGEVREYIAVFSLKENTIVEGQFEVTVNMQYSYHETVESIKEFTITKILPVTITDKNNFVKIENKYDKIMRQNSIFETPELFKGRDELINSICASMATQDGNVIKNKGIILWGQRRVGKNSVKDFLKDKIKDTYSDAYIIIDFSSVANSRNFNEFLKTLINKTKHILQFSYTDIYNQLLETGVDFNMPQLIGQADFTSFMTRFSLGLDKICGSKKIVPLYFFDEFTRIYEWIEQGKLDGDEFAKFWKSFMQDYGICAIMIAQDNMPIWTTKYQNEFACMNLENVTYLDFKGTKELVCEPCRINDKDIFTPDAVQLIYNWTKGSAYLVNVLCKYIIDYLNENYMEKATKTIVQIVFEKKYVDEKELLENRDFESQIQDTAYVGEEGEQINYLNEELLKEIAGKTVNSVHIKKDDLEFFIRFDRDKAEKVFNRLKERKIIEVEGGYCMICMPLLKFYLLGEQGLLTREVFNKLTR